MKDNQIMPLSNALDRAEAYLSLACVSLRILDRNVFGRGKKIEVSTQNEEDWKFTFWSQGNKRVMAVF